MTMLLARVADNLYWAARYLERAEDTARVIVQHTNLIVDVPTDAGVRWDALLAISGTVDGYRTGGRELDEHSIVRFLVDDPDNAGCLLHAVTAARENFRGARDIVPRAAWQAVNDLYHFVSARHDEGVSRAGRARFCDQLINGAQRVVGVLAGTMSRDAAYDVLRLGRHLERADMTTRVLDVGAGGLLAAESDIVRSRDFDDIRWSSVLRSLSALQMYRRATRGPVDGPAVVRFCLTDAHFPRSVAFCLDDVEQCIARISDAVPLHGLTDAARGALAGVEDAVFDSGALHRLADELQCRIADVDRAMSEAWFGHAPNAGDTGRIGAVQS